eukprot:960758-Rhodomonas_salina.2
MQSWAQCSAPSVSASGQCINMCEIVSSACLQSGHGASVAPCLLRCTIMAIRVWVQTISLACLSALVDYPCWLSCSSASMV